MNTRDRNFLVVVAIVLILTTSGLQPLRASSHDSNSALVNAFLALSSAEHAGLNQSEVSAIASKLNLAIVLIQMGDTEGAHSGSFLRNASVLINSSLSQAKSESAAAARRTFVERAEVWSAVPVASVLGSLALLWTKDFYISHEEKKLLSMTVRMKRGEEEQ